MNILKIIDKYIKLYNEVNIFYHHLCMEYYLQILYLMIMSQNFGFCDRKISQKTLKNQ